MLREVGRGKKGDMENGREGYISLVSQICGVLNISEHELITASEDMEQKKLEKQAASYQKILHAYSITMLVVYGITLVSCFIANLALERRLSWFFVAMWSVTLGLSVVFLPFILPSLPLPGSLYQHKALLCIAADTVLLFILLASALHFTGNMGAYFTIACPVALAGLLYVWVLLAVIRYLKIHPYFRTAMVLGFSGIYYLFINNILHVIIDRVPFQMQPCDFRIWNEDYINGNTTMILFLICILLAAAFTKGGITITVKNGVKNHKVK